jgi:phosphotransferase system HPr (HPr) family protein
MTARSVTIHNQTGLHIRPASLMVATANRFQSTVRVAAGEREADGRSILSLMLLELAPGAGIVIRAEGEDEEQAVDALAALVESGFSE